MLCCAARTSGLFACATHASSTAHASVPLMQHIAITRSAVLKAPVDGAGHELDHGLDRAVLDEPAGDGGEADADLQLEARAVLPNARELCTMLGRERINHVIGNVRERFRACVGAMPPRFLSSQANR